MMGYDEARATLSNNLTATLNVIWAVLRHTPECHIIKLGTMGEYGTPNIDIEEGWIDIQHKGRRDKFLFPRQAGSLYHTTKILDTDLLWFYVRIDGLSVTDLTQGPVYGLSTYEADLYLKLAPNFHYDYIFGTVANWFLVQAVAGTPLTIYGKGGQVRGYLNLRDLCNASRWLQITRPARASCGFSTNSPRHSQSISWLSESSKLQLAWACRSRSNISTTHARSRKNMTTTRRTTDYSNSIEATLYDGRCNCGDARPGSCDRDQIVVDRILPRVKWR